MVRIILNILLRLGMAFIIIIPIVSFTLQMITLSGVFEHISVSHFIGILIMMALLLLIVIKLVYILSNEIIKSYSYKKALIIIVPIVSVSFILKMIISSGVFKHISVSHFIGILIVMILLLLIIIEVVHRLTNDIIKSYKKGK
ncbi:hypothetical protein B5591_22540 [Salmonella enterica]|nr:hypothetical protein [Salmonella enterica]